MSQTNVQAENETDWDALWGAGINTDPSLARIVKKGSPDWNFDDRIREAYILLENRLREVAGLPSYEYGAGLVDAAFSPNKGILQPVSSVGAENAGLHELFHGAFLYYRNPSAHRTVNHNKQSAWLIFHLINHLLLTLDVVAETVVPITGFVSPHEGRIRRRKDFRLDIDQDGEDELLICLDVAETVTSDGYENHLLPVILDKQGKIYRRIPCESLPGESMYGAYSPSLHNITGTGRPDIVLKWAAGETGIMLVVERWTGDRYVIARLDIQGIEEPYAGPFEVGFFWHGRQEVAFVDFDGDGVTEIVQTLSFDQEKLPDMGYPRKQFKDIIHVCRIWKWDTSKQSIALQSENGIIYRPALPRF